VRLKNGGVGVSYRIEALYAKPSDRGYMVDNYTLIRGWSNRIFVGEAKIKALTLPPPGTGFIQAQDKTGLICIEAEHYNQKIDRSDHQWTLVPKAEASGGAVMKALPEQGTTILDDYGKLSPELTYQVYFRKAGLHYVWIRGLALSDKNDSCHIGVDGRTNGKESWQSSEIYGYSLDGQLSWGHLSTREFRVPANFQVDAPGLHTVSLWMHKDGFTVDRILITSDKYYQPEGAGPPESRR
jgi:hypothetical protein